MASCGAATAAAAPTVTINQAATQADPTNASPIRFTVVFSEPVSGFTASDVSLAGSTVGGTLMRSLTGGGPSFTVTVTGMSGQGTLVASIPAGVANSESGPNEASTSTDNTVSFDNVRPSVTVNQAAAQPDPTNASPILFTVTFSEPVTGFTASDVSLAASTVSGTLMKSVSGSGAVYAVSVTGMSGAGSLVAGVAANAATDALGNDSLASTSTDNTVTFDAVKPSLTVDQAAAQPDPTNASPILFTVTFSEPVTGFTTSDVSLAGSTAGGRLEHVVTGSGANYTVSVTGMESGGLVVASVAAGAAVDATGNTSFASTSTDNSVTLDDVRPGVTIDQALAQADPTHSKPVLFSVAFSEAVTGFTSSDVSLAGSTLPVALTVSVTGSGASYTVSVAFPISASTGSGTIVVGIPANAASDLAGNLSFVSTSSDDTVAVVEGNERAVDFNADRRTDHVAYHPAGQWFIRDSFDASVFTMAFGASGYTPLLGDFDGDDRSDMASFHPPTGLWFIRSTATGVVTSSGFGGSGYEPVRGDFDGDGKTDLAVFHDATGLWFIKNSSDGTVTTIGYGASGYVPVPGDYDGDGKTNLAMYHPPTGLWFVRSAAGTTTTTGFGGAAYTPVRGDFDGDGRTDVAVYHETSGLWFVRNSSTGAITTTGFGAAGYAPVPEDYDADGKTDLAVYHQPSGLWFVKSSATGATSTVGFGGLAYVPLN